MTSDSPGRVLPVPATVPTLELRMKDGDSALNRELGERDATLPGAS